MAGRPRRNRARCKIGLCRGILQQKFLTISRFARNGTWDFLRLRRERATRASRREGEGFGFVRAFETGSKNRLLVG